MPIVAVSKMEPVAIIAFGSVGFEGGAGLVVMQRNLIVGDN